MKMMWIKGGIIPIDFKISKLVN